MIHLTHTGAAAGEPLCGAPRAEPTPALRFHHPNVEALAKDWYRASCCPHCLAIWDGALEPENPA